MNKIDISFVFLSCLIGAICYVCISNLLLSVLVVVLYLLDYFVLLRKRFNYYFDMTERVNSCFHFVNSFVITLSVTESLEEAYSNATRVSSKRFNEIIKGIEDHNVVDRVMYLKNYFKLSIYKMFLNVFELYQDQGGNILNMADNLLTECTRVEKTLSETKAIGYKHLVEFILLWTMSLGILVFMRFSIKDFYSDMLQNAFIGPMIFLFFVICLFSINLFINAFTNLSIKEDNNDSKVKE